MQQCPSSPACALQQSLPPHLQEACEAAEAKARLDANIVDGITTFAGLADHFGPGAADDDEASAFKGWVRVSWSKPTGAALDEVDLRLKALKLTIRNTPMAQDGAALGPCIFTGAPGVETILVARAY